MTLPIGLSFRMLARPLKRIASQSTLNL
jgi:hypothetical protein